MLCWPSVHTALYTSKTRNQWQTFSYIGETLTKHWTHLMPILVSVSVKLWLGTAVGQHFPSLQWLRRPWVAVVADPYTGETGLHASYEVHLKDPHNTIVNTGPVYTGIAKALCSIDKDNRGQNIALCSTDTDRHDHEESITWCSIDKDSRE